MGGRDQRQAEEEAAVFGIFLDAHPALKAQVTRAIQPAEEFPDVTVTLPGHEEIDFELGEWLHDGQMQRAKKVERLRVALLKAIGEQAANGSQHFRFVMLKLREDPPRFDGRDGERIRAEMFRFVAETEMRWPTERHWHSTQGYRCTDFGDYPILAKYLATALFDPLRFGMEPGKRWPAGEPWILVERPSGSYSGESARQALRAIIEKKIGQYGGFGRRRVHLLVYYRQAAIYNTPYHDLGYESFADVARAAAQWLADSKLLFEKVYVLNAAEPERQAFEIYPAFAGCE